MHTIDDLIVDLKYEMAQAQAKFPGNKHMLAAISEEHGELAQALLQQDQEPNKNINHRDIYNECIQVACTALRLAMEGDSNFPLYHPESGYRGDAWPGYQSNFRCEQCQEIFTDQDCILIGHHKVCSDKCEYDWGKEHE